MRYWQKCLKTGVFEVTDPEVQLTPRSTTYLTEIIIVKSVTFKRPQIQEYFFLDGST